MPKSVSRALVLLSALWMPPIAAAQLPQSVTSDPVRLAYVSAQRAFYESNDGKAAQARLTTLQVEMEREADARNAKLKALQESLAKGATVLAESARREREQEIGRFQIDLQRF